MKKFLLAVLFCAFCLQASAQPVLRFQKDKPFRIMQLTDLHYVHAGEYSQRTVDNVNEMLRTEKPDLVVLTGDLICGRPGYESMKDVLDLVSSYKIPFAVTFGNHDDEQGLSREELFDIIKTYPYSLTAKSEGITGVTNYVLPILASDSDAPSQLLYVFDSNSYCEVEVEGAENYDFIHVDQICWYMELSKAYKQANGGQPLPALAFFHIALPEYNIALRSGADFIGTKREEGGEPVFNSGLFAASKLMGDIRCYFVGHDHNDDYLTIYHGVGLAYGRYSGSDVVYNDVKPNGCRMIELTEGQDSFRTYLRLFGGAIINDVLFPDFFGIGK